MLGFLIISLDMVIHHSQTHLYGWESDHAVETACSHVAALIGASPKEIVLTSGATESNNISIKGVMNFYREKKRHLITIQTEHKCVLDSCRHLQQVGFEITYLPVGSDGIVDLDKLRSAIRPDTGLVCTLCLICRYRTTPSSSSSSRIVIRINSESYKCILKKVAELHSHGFLRCTGRMLAVLQVLCSNIH
ncbi:cysteine desulfurase, mitochondrial-like isoform X2 [Cucurbita maxima]|uniref:Cysteine desulfurase, mitochondrial-like isoform X2 n=1 Tax=Cucurbita maxima TaxID=3661 RepID=A0A6J1IQC5_CUCMA|nr:cysteine desulfurase, mitochondrial-like isoform X2 [Cucurbita maxima]